MKDPIQGPRIIRDLEFKHMAEKETYSNMRREDRVFATHQLVGGMVRVASLARSRLPSKSTHTDTERESCVQTAQRRREGESSKEIYRKWFWGNEDFGKNGDFEISIFCLSVLVLLEKLIIRLWSLRKLAQHHYNNVHLILF